MCKKFYKIYSEKIRYCKLRKIIRYFRDKDLTIISSDCIGGVIYHDLKKKFLSPTINLSFSEFNYSFLYFIKYLKLYLIEELNFIDSDTYPRATIGGNGVLPIININFVHYKNRFEAELDWNKRKRRIVKNIKYIYVKFILDDKDIELLNDLNFPVFVITSNKTNESLIASAKEKKNIHISKYLSTLNKNDGKLMSYIGLNGSRRYDDLNIFEYLKK